MTKVNFHMHSTGSDGKLSPREVVLEAIKAKITHMCFTDHFHIPEEVKKYNERHTPSYYKELEELKKEFSNKIDISIGLEVDWIPGHENWVFDRIKKRDYDFLLGSVHFLQDDNGKFEYTEDLINSANNDPAKLKKLILEYYEEVIRLIDSGLIDSIAHLDLVKKKLTQKEILNEPWYKEEVMKVLSTLKKNKKCFEINTSGWALVNEQYPARWILEEANKMNIPITIGSDFHNLVYSKNIDFRIEDAIKLAKEVGYKKIMIFKNRKAKEIMI